MTSPTAETSGPTPTASVAGASDGPSPSAEEQAALEALRWLIDAVAGYPQP